MKSIAVVSILVLPGAVGFDIAGNIGILTAGETTVFGSLASGADVSAAEMEDRIQQLGKQLGAPSFSQRESAERRLVEIGVPARAALERLTGSDDPEVARRARSALAAISVTNGVAPISADQTTAVWHRTVFPDPRGIAMANRPPVRTARSIFSITFKWSGDQAR